MSICDHTIPTDKFILRIISSRFKKQNKEKIKVV